MELLIIKTEDIMRFKKVQRRAAQKEIKRIKDYFEKADFQLLTNIEVAEYYDIPVSVLHQEMTPKD